MKSIIISDLDLTLTRKSLMDALSAHHVERGIVSPRIREKSGEIIRRYRQGLIGYGQASREALELWVEALKGNMHADLVIDAREFFSVRRDVFYPFFPEMRAKYRATHDFYLVTANFDFVAQAVCEIFSLDGYAATSMVIDGGVCAGTTDRTLLSSDQKGAETETLLRRYDATASIGMGDTENDIGLLGKVAHPLCINANDKLRKTAIEKGWPLVGPEDVLKIVRGFGV